MQPYLYACAREASLTEPIPQLAFHLKPTPGLYALFGTDDAWKQLGLGPSNGPGPLYVGKAEDSFVSRGLSTHFSSGQTAQSTVRRSFAALLRDSWVQGVPRNREKPEHFAKYGLTVGDDATLTEWMWRHLALTVWGRWVLLSRESSVRSVCFSLLRSTSRAYLDRPAEISVWHGRQWLRTRGGGRRIQVPVRG